MPSTSRLHPQLPRDADDDTGGEDAINDKDEGICDVYDRHCDNSQDLVLYMYLPSRVVVKVQ